MKVSDFQETEFEFDVALIEMRVGEYYLNHRLVKNNVQPSRNEESVQSLKSIKIQLLW